MLAKISKPFFYPKIFKMSFPPQDFIKHNIILFVVEIIFIHKLMYNKQ